MRNLIRMTGLLLALSIAAPGQARIFDVDLSPAGPGLNLGTNPYTRDHAVGIAGDNVAGGTTGSTATGNEIGGGITFDDSTGTLSWEIGYGSDFGFSDLLGTFSVAHVHGPSAVLYPADNMGAGVVFGLDHTAGSSANTGSFVGTRVLTSGEQTMLLNNEFYVNIHSSRNGGGEIRGQMIPVPEPSSLVLVGLGILGAFVRWRQR